MELFSQRWVLLYGVLLTFLNAAFGKHCIKHHRGKVLENVIPVAEFQAESLTECVSKCFNTKEICAAVLYHKQNCTTYPVNSMNNIAQLVNAPSKQYDLYEIMDCRDRNSRRRAARPRWLPWSTWSDCTVSCGEGQIKRHRKCSKKTGCRGEAEQILNCDGGPCDPIDVPRPPPHPPGFAGVPVPVLGQQEKPGFPDPAFAHLKISRGQWGIWSPWGPCGVPCGRGQKKRFRFCLSGNDCDGEKMDTRECTRGSCAIRTGPSNRQPGPQFRPQPQPRPFPSLISEGQKSGAPSTNLNWMEWSAWSTCEAPRCEKIRRRQCPGYLCKGQSVEQQKCPSCSTGSSNCAWTSWSPAGSCSQTCGKSSLTMRRDCTCNFQLSRGSCPGPDTRRDACMVPQQCPQVGQWQPWTGSCNRGCGSPTIQRQRPCPVPNRCGQPTQEVQNCPPRPSCPQQPTSPPKCQWQEWSTASCSATCGTGQKVSSRRCDCPSQASQPCAGRNRRVTECTRLPPCVSCSWTSWEGWTQCSATCGQGVKTNKRVCNCAQGQGDCDGSKEKHQACFAGDCSAWTPWAAWGRCSVTCGVGIRTRKRFCDGQDCEGDPQQTAICKPGDCPKRCRWQPWTRWADCSATCGAGVKSRDRKCDCPPNSVGRCFGGNEDFSHCKAMDCPVWRNWEPWSQCSVTCGVGLKDRTRKCSQEDLCEGSRIQTTMCREQGCPSGCTWAEWGVWSKCSVTCSKGIISRNRGCNCRGTNQLSCKGMNTTYAECCPGDCPQWQQWGPWNPCTVTCGTGLRDRIRQCSHGGGVCGTTFNEVTLCTANRECPKECIWSPWAPWSRCSVTCEDGIRNRKRECDCSARNSNGKCFGVDATYTKCSEGSCPKWTTWRPWNPCSVTCGQGVRDRSRMCSHRDQQRCLGHNSESGLCDMSPCPKECLWRTWNPWETCSSTCGKGVQKRNRECSCGQAQCDGSDASYKDCSSISCPQWGPWERWSPCSVTCGSGIIKRSRRCRGGMDCKGVSEETDICTKQDCSSDCWADWGPWSGCPATCGMGVKSRDRSCKCRDPTKCQGPTKEYTECDQGFCPDWKPWYPWSPCSVTCGIGLRVRNRDCSIPGSCRGLKKETGICTLSPCKEPCEWLEWQSWKTCSVSCANGIRSRKRSCGCTTPGETCSGSDTTYSECSQGACPSWSAWNPWGVCSTTCGAGLQLRSRKCSTPNKCTGSNRQLTVCNLKKCPLPCEHGNWQPWSPCSVSCGDGLKSRERPCQCSGNSFGVTCNGANTTYNQCQLGPCPSWQPWAPWSICSRTCGSGLRNRNRVCSIPGLCAGSRKEVGVCNLADCKPDCTWKPWSDFGPCSETCGAGFKSKFRRCTCFNSLTANCIGSNVTYTECTGPDCPRWLTWTPWTQCSATCGEGIKRRSRVCSIMGECQGSNEESLLCTMNQCDPGCRWEAWMPWGECSMTCDKGIRSRKRPCSCPDQSACTGSSISFEECSGNVCPHWNPWSRWGDCSATCGQGIQTRNRRCTHNNLCQGSPNESNICQKSDCMESCKWGLWAKWTTCSVTCSKGVKSRTRSCDCSNGGKPPCSGSKVGYIQCDEGDCPTWLAWQPWGQCSRTCGAGLRTRTRRCSRDNLCEGSNTETGLCNTRECSPLCQWDSWQPWESCSVSCDEGIKSRKRNCLCTGTTQQSCSGMNTTYIGCRAGNCPLWQPWQQWSPCGVTCGSGVRSRQRVCSQPNMCPGDSKEVSMCTTGECATSCIWDKWGPWGPCSTTCGGGIRSKTRNCNCPFGGEFCSGSKQTYEECGKQDCPQWSAWTPWEGCSVTCGSGIRKRSRKCSIEGECEGSTIQTGICTKDPCPTGCPWKMWTPWGQCSVSCGVGVKSRERDCSCTSGSPTCQGSKSSYMQCDNGECPMWNPWRSWTICSTTCGDGIRKRSRTCTVGTSCEGLNLETSMCKQRECDPECKYSTWEPWNQCSTSCGLGVQSRIRKCSCFAPNQVCQGPKQHFQECGAENQCPAWQAWQPWSPCSVTCATGLRVRARKCSIDGKCEGMSQETSICSHPDCNPMKGCTWTPWGRWDACSVSCGAGIRAKKRQCNCVDSSLTCSGTNSTHDQCDAGLCPFWQTWRQWSSCSVTCGDGIRKRSRACSQFNLCPGVNTETSMCKENSCSEDCPWRSWNTWGECSTTCGEGVKARTRSCSCPNSALCKGSTESYAECSSRACPQWMPWKRWGTCSQTCGTGFRKRTRKCSNGNLCKGSNEETGVCKGPECERECEWRPWARWGQCSVTCGTGLKTRNRICGCSDGSCDGQRTSYDECQAQQCPVWRSWQPWTPCSTTCGPGVRTRKRQCSMFGLCSGSDTGTSLCNEKECAQPCQWSSWNPWGKCSVSCGKGIKSQNRDCRCSNNPRNEGCSGTKVAYSECTSDPCPAWREWARWSPCSVTCGVGLRQRNRKCSLPGLCIGNSLETGICTEPKCTKKCDWRSWAPWEKCSATCGSGVIQRSRQCQCQDGRPGTCDGPDQSFKACESGQCPAWTAWQPWGTCSVTCGSGLRKRSRTCSSPGKCLGVNEETSVCTAADCAPDCSWRPWGLWGQCSISCGTGLKSRSRECACMNHRTQPNCDGANSTYTECTMGPCPSWNAWRPWGICSVTCGLGIRQRNRDCSRQSLCSGSNLETSICDTKSDCDDGCSWSPWGPWEPCSKTCNEGLKERTRECSCGAGKCSDSDKSYAECNDGLCPSWSPWQRWSACSVTCGIGLRTRARLCSSPGACKGSPTENSICNAPSCSAECEWSNWAEWGSCSVSCGSGLKSTQRNCGCGEGMCTGSSMKYMECDGGQCPAWQEWQPWSKCSRTCGEGIRTRSRSCSGPQHLCAGLNLETSLCETLPQCASQCQWGNWNPWSTCSVTCGDGLKSATRGCPCGEGSCTGSKTTYAECNTGRCPGWGHWNRWGQCSVTCGTGLRKRTRTCSSGNLCQGSDAQTGICSVPTSCADSCSWNSWNSWSSCSVTCGSGLKSAKRSCSCSPQSFQKTCSGADTTYATCTTNNCPEWRSWTPWGPCSLTCGKGIRQRSRRCSGAGCIGDTMETSTCTESQCASQTCGWSLWNNWSPCSVSCGKGLQSKDRRCNCRDSTQCSGSKTMYQHCDSNTCAQWGHWTPWTQCSVSCGVGIRTRNKVCSQKGQCKGPPTETSICNQGQCQQSCEWSAWDNWSPCSSSCGAGIQAKTRTCPCGATGCQGSGMSYSECDDNRQCPSWEGWTRWSACSRTCGTGVRKRERRCANAKNCAGEAIETSLCEGNQGCPEFCSWQSWGSWSQCSNNCGTGHQLKTRHCSCANGLSGECGGGSNTTYKECDRFCPIVAVKSNWQAWQPWQPCTVTCGSGLRKRKRSCEEGEECKGEDLDQRLCEQEICPEEKQACKWKEWSDWSKCSVTCGDGRKTRSRDCSCGKDEGQCDGPSRTYAWCSGEPCSSWTFWSPWSSCTSSCGLGQMSRKRNCAGTHCNGDTLDTLPCVGPTCKRCRLDPGRLGSCN